MQYRLITISQTPKLDNTLEWMSFMMMESNSPQRLATIGWMKSVK